MLAVAAAEEAGRPYQPGPSFHPNRPSAGAVEGAGVVDRAFRPLPGIRRGRFASAGSSHRPIAARSRQQEAQTLSYPFSST